MQTSNREKTIQNLKACSCDEQLIKNFMADLDAGKTKDALRLLQTHRKLLLEHFHRYSDSIECLDYLVYNIEKGK